MLLEMEIRQIKREDSDNQFGYNIHCQNITDQHYKKTREKCDIRNLYLPKLSPSYKEYRQNYIGCKKQHIFFILTLVEEKLQSAKKCFGKPQQRTSSEKLIYSTKNQIDKKQGRNKNKRIG